MLSSRDQSLAVGSLFLGWFLIPTTNVGVWGWCASGRSSRVFAPPIGPPDPVRCTSGLHDLPLISGIESSIEAGQRGLDEPRFEGHPCGLAIGIKFLGHSQRRQGRCDAPGCHTCADDDAGKALVCAGSFRDLLDHGQSCAGCGAITFKPAFDELQQERLGRRDTGSTPPSRMVTICPRTAS